MPGATGAVTPAASVTPPLFHVVGAEPVIRRGTFPDRDANLPVAVTVDDGTYHAWLIAFGDVPGNQQLHHLTSRDAVTWTERPDASLEALSDGLGNPGAFPTYVAPDGDGWLMFFTGTAPGENPIWEIRRATAPGPDGPWTRLEEPVVRHGPAGAWDAGGIDFPALLRTGDGYRLLYSGVDPSHPETGAIGLATSPDGINWTKHDDPATTEARTAESDPVIEPGLCGGFDGRAVHQPRTVQLGERVLLTYAGYAGDVESPASIGIAESLDGGLTWECRWPAPALETEGLPDGFVHTQAAFELEGRLALLVEWFSGRGSDVWLAEAPSVLP
jgi:hypothetical protein